MNVTTKDGHKPPATVIHPDQPESGDTGSAELSEADGTTTLLVKGTNAFGESISLRATCGPGPG